MKKIILILLFLYTGLLSGKNNEINLAKMDFLIKTHDFKKAYKELKQIDIKKIPKDKKALFYNKAGFINYKLGKMGPALKNYLSAVTLNSNLYFVYNNIGVTYSALKKYNKAKQYYLKAYNKKNKYPKVMVNLAVVNFYLKKYEEAFKWLKKALFSSEDYVKKRFDKKRAIKKLEEWVGQNPDDKDLQKMLKWARKNTDKKITDIDFIEEYF